MAASSPDICSCSWNNSLSHATFTDNVDRVGQEEALRLLREDIRSWIRERKGEASGWSLSVRDGQMVTDTGVSLREMTNNITNGPHSDLVPEHIKATAPLEAATLQEATRLASAGAHRIVFPEQHLDGEGNVVSRYLSVWTKDVSDPTRYHGSRIDLGKNLRIEDVRTGTSFAAFGQRHGVSFHQHAEEKHAFVLAIQNDTERPFETVEKAIVTTIHCSHQETYSRDVHADAPQKDERSRWAWLEVQQTPIAQSIQGNRRADMLVDVPRAVVRDTVETVRGVALFLRDKEKRTKAKERRLFEKGGVGSYPSEGQTERLTLENIREKPVKMIEVIEKRHRKVRKEVVMLAIIAETGVAIHAAPFILASLAEKLPVPVLAVVKSMRRHEKRELRMKNKELRRIAKQETKKDSVKVQPLRSERIEPLRVAKERKARRKRGQEIGVKRVATAEKLTPIVTKRRERREKQRLQRVVRIAKQETKKDSVKVQPLRSERIEPFRVAKERKKKKIRAKVKREVKVGNRKELGRPVKRAKEIGVKRVATAEKLTPIVTKRRERREKQRLQRVVKVQPLIERKRSTKRKEREAVAGMVFGWMVWMMLNRANFPPVESKIAMLVQERRGATRLHRLMRSICGQELIRPSGDQHWVLLSIIWYLTAIREQGRGSNPTNVLPKYAVIFAYNS